MRFTEVYEQPKLQSAHAQLSKKLFRVNGKQRFLRFEFRDNFSVHNQVGPKSFIKPNVIVNLGIGF